jgi:hypothetical protein
MTEPETTIGDMLGKQTARLLEIANNLPDEPEEKSEKPTEITPEWLKALRRGKYPARHTKRLADSNPLNGDASHADIWNRIRAGDATVILAGLRGTGKTQVATEWAARLAIDGRSPGIYTKCYDLLADIKSTWHNGAQTRHTEADVLKKYRTAKYLVIDEWTEKSSGEWETATLINLLDHRYDDMLSTILICNSPVEKLQEHVAASILDRVTETGGTRIFNGPNWRHAK